MEIKVFITNKQKFLKDRKSQSKAGVYLAEARLASCGGTILAVEGEGDEYVFIGNNGIVLCCGDRVKVKTEFVRRMDMYFDLMEADIEETK